MTEANVNGAPLPSLLLIRIESSTPPAGESTMGPNLELEIGFVSATDVSAFMKTLCEAGLLLPNPRPPCRLCGEGTYDLTVQGSRVELAFSLCVCELEGELPHGPKTACWLGIAPETIALHSPQTEWPPYSGCPSSSPFLVSAVLSLMTIGLWCARNGIASYAFVAEEGFAMRPNSQTASVRAPVFVQRRLITTSQRIASSSGEGYQPNSWLLVTDC